MMVHNQGSPYKVKIMRLNKHKHSWISNSIIALFLLLLLVTCEKEADKPTGSNKVVLNSTSVDSPGYFNVNASCSFTQTGGQTITGHGFCYATTPNPDINAFVKNLGKHSGSSDFSAAISNLEDNKKYYIRAFATIAGGTLYAQQKEITTLKSGKPRISTVAVSNITPAVAVCGGVIESDSGYVITASGICWDTDDQFDLLQCLGKAINNTGNTTFSLSLSGLTEGTAYHVKAWASNQKGTSYGETRQFSSATITIPTVTTNAITNPTANSAVGGGNVTNAGNATVTARGVCWNKTGSPSIQNCIGFTDDGEGIGSYTSNITGLSDGVTYFVKAYATNLKGTGYGTQVDFTTLAITLPTVTTTAITNPTTNSATGGGNVTNSGNATVTARGVCWNTTGNPTLQSCINFTSDGQGTGTFTSNISGLNASTTYFVRAYATNSEGTAYDVDDVSFTTLAPCVSFSINHTAGPIAPVDKNVNYGTVETNLTGNNKCWITQNLGSDRQALSATEGTESSAGWYWQFNCKQGFKHDGSTRTPNTTWISNISENSDWLLANDPCTLLLGSGWRLPTRTEWYTADATGGWDNYSETYSSVLKLHAAGFLGSSDGSLSGRGSYGLYWSSSQNDSDFSHYLAFYNGDSGMGSTTKATGFSARCLRD